MEQGFLLLHVQHLRFLLLMGSAAIVGFPWFEFLKVAAIKQF